jgi:D-cysteine desulfhydrase
VAGNVLLGRPWTLVGGSVSRPVEDAAPRVLALARECARLMAGAGVLDHGGAARGQGRTVPGTAEPSPGDVVVVDARGPGHGLPSPEGAAAAELAMRMEGLMVDPVYTAKALALVPRYADGGDMVFWHTGGLLDAVAATAGAQP